LENCSDDFLFTSQTYTPLRRRKKKKGVTGNSRKAEGETLKIYREISITDTLVMLV